MILFIKQLAKTLISLRICAGWFAPLLFVKPRRQVLSRRDPYNIGFMLLHLRAELTCKGLEMSQYEGLCNYFVSLNGHQWNRLVSDLHKKAFADCIINFDEFEEKRRKLSSTKGEGSEHFLLVMNSRSLLSERFL